MKKLLKRHPRLLTTSKTANIEYWWSTTTKDSAEALATLLELHGYACMVAFDGTSALALAETFGPTVGVIDLGLPDISGFDVAMSLRNGRVTAPLTLVALSGYSGNDYRANAAQAGFDHYFAKPLLIRIF